MIELALPAGSLSTALTAYRHGADAVYFGLKDFSARKGAVNFSMEDLSKIRRFSLENGKKTYITINTLISDDEISKLTDTLEEVAYYGSDGIIVQDLGVARIIRRHFPSLPLHGSTQLAVHTTEGVKVLQDLGFERVVLSRELTLKEIEAIRKDCPDVELKAFIHGALCYGFSGLCSASALKCGRSANGGQCAQICRSWFTDEESGRKGYFFSMEDMDAGEEILELDRMGIDSAKVEGRLKSPEYVAAVADYYSNILRNGRKEKEDQERIATTFLRKSGDGYFTYRKDRPSLLSGEYPGHMGLEIGKVIEERGLVRTIGTEKEIENHDGLQYFTLDSNGLPVPEKFSAHVLERSRGKYRIRIDSRESLLGKTIFKISDSTRREKTQSTNIPLFRKPVPILIRLDSHKISAFSGNISLERDFEAQEAKTPKDLADTLRKTFSESGDSRYTLGSLKVENNSGLPSPFLPPSFLKDFRRAFYSCLDERKEEKVEITEAKEEHSSIVLPERNLLSGDLPWSLEPKEIEGRTYITLPPVTFNEKATWEKALESVRGRKNVTIGLNNIGQINFAKAHPEYSYFADIWLYVPNRFAASLLMEEIPSFAGGYLWFEKKEYSGPWPWKPTVTFFQPPYFISRTCYRHDALKKECRGCSGRENYTISQFPDTFTVKVRSCLTVVERNS